jgi:prolyl oligopeptidase
MAALLSDHPFDHLRRIPTLGAVMRLELSRRRLLASGAAVGLFAPVADARAAIAIPPAPVARKAVVRDVYFGETIEDPYRWMENDQDPDWLPYLKAQNDRTRKVLDALPGRDALLTRIGELTGATVATGRIQRAGARLFFQQRPLNADNFKLYVKEGGVVRLLIDPTAVRIEKGHVSLDWWRASPNGSHVVYGLSPNGSEDSILHILSTADGQALPETIADAQSADPQWLEDGSGFFYTQLTGAADTPERYLDAQARFHRLGEDPARDPILMRRGLDPKVSFDKIQMPSIRPGTGSRFALLELNDVRSEARLFIAPLPDVISGRADWTEFAGFEDEVTNAELIGDTLYLLTTKDASRGKIVTLDARDPKMAKATVVVPQSERVITEISYARNGLFIVQLDGGPSRLQRLDGAGQIQDIALPFEGAIGAAYASPQHDGVWLSLSGWLAPTGVWSVDAADRMQNTGLNPVPKIDLSPYVATRFAATAKDGTRVPYTLIRRKDVTPNGRNPLWMSAYGSYGAVMAPGFSAKTLALIDAGAIVGYANVRGGGEYGKAWHRAGQLENKPNTWRDLIAVCEDVCAKGWTAPRHLAIGGRSAGGITVGRAMTERPDLFAAVIDGVGWSNPLRYVAEPNGYGEEPEWGAIREEKGYRALKSIDSYHAVQDGVNYPAVLLTTGVTDPRVAPFHVAKMTARLQAATASDNPILLRVDYDAGHGIGSTRSQADREAADTYAFLLWRLRP